MFRLLLTCVGLVTLDAIVTIPLHNYKLGIQAFYSNVSVGTPPQNFSALFEVSRGLSYFPSSKCKDPACLHHRRYDSSKSSTYQADGTPFDVGYGQNVSGILSRDVIGVAGVAVTDQTFGEATQVLNKWYSMIPNDASIGLGFSESAANGTASPPDNRTSLLDDMAAQGLISRRVVGMWLGNGSSDGELTLGGVNERRYAGELTYVPLLRPTKWAFTTGGIRLDGLPAVTGCQDGCAASMISGTPYFIVSMERAKVMNDALGAVPIDTPGAASLDCTTLYQLPNMTIRIADRTVEMTPLEYVFISPIPPYLQLCISGFIGSPFVQGDTWLFGTLFMEKMYTVFDMDNARIGFADSA